MAEASKSKKAKKKNPFLLFCDDQRERLKRNGFWDGTLESLIRLCHEDWNSLPEGEKELYKQRSKDQQDHYVFVDSEPVKANDKRLDATGKPLTDRVNYQTEAMRRRDKELSYIRRHRGDGKDCCESSFLLINFVPLAELAEGPLPCELALVEYSLVAGITNTYHTFVDPGKLPVGSKARIKDASENGHKVPVVGFELFNADYRQIWDDIIQFASARKTGSTESTFVRPLYCSSSQAQTTEKLLNRLAKDAKKPNLLREKVFEMEALCIALSEAAVDATGDESLLMDQSISQSSIADANQEFGSEKSMCSFHKDEEEGCLCALSVAKSRAYLLSETFCDPFEVEKTENHLPNLAPASYVTRGFTSLSGPSGLPRTTYNERQRYSRTAAASHSQTTQYAPSHGQQRDYQQQYVASLSAPSGGGTAAAPAPSWGAPPPTAPSAGAGASGAHSAVGRGVGRGSHASSQATQAPGANAWGPTNQTLPGTARPPGAVAAPTRALAAASAPRSAAAAIGSVGGSHGDWTPPATFPAEDVRELEAAMAQASIASSTARSAPPPQPASPESNNSSGGESADAGWEVAGRKRGGRGRGVRSAGPQQPLRRPRDIQGPRPS